MTAVMDAEPSVEPEGQVVIETGSIPLSVIFVDPRELHSRANVRSDLGDLTELADSIRREGVLQPPRISEDPDGGYIVHWGHRRTAASIIADQATIPAILGPDIPDGIDLTVAQLVENVQRADLSAADHNAAIAMMLDFPGATIARVAKRLGVGKEVVTKARDTYALPSDVQAKVLSSQMTLEDAAALAEFEDNPKVYERLMRAAASGGMHWALTEERRKIELRQRKAEIKARLTDEGVPLISLPNGADYHSQEAKVEELGSGKGKRPDKPLTVAGHRRCAGHAAYIDTRYGRDPQVVYVCKDPDKYGHRRLRSSGFVSEEAKAAKEAEAAREAELIEQFHTARELRFEFLRKFLAGKPVKEITRRALVLLLAFAPRASKEEHGALVADLMVVTTHEGEGLGTRYSEVLDRTADARLIQHAVAHMAAVGEANFAEVGRRWNFDMVCALAWFDLLEKMGYEFHDSEIQIRERALAYRDERRREAEERAAQEAEADEDDDPDEGEIGDGFAYAEDQMDAEEEALEGEDGLADEQFGDELSDGDLTDADLSVGDLSTDDPADDGELDDSDDEADDEPLAAEVASGAEIVEVALPDDDLDAEALAEFEAGGGAVSAVSSPVDDSVGQLVEADLEGDAGSDD